MKRSLVMVVVACDLAMAGSGLWLILRASRPATAAPPVIARADTPAPAPAPPPVPDPPPAPAPDPVPAPAPAPAPAAAPDAAVPARVRPPRQVQDREPIPPLVLPKPDAAPPPPDAAPPPPPPDAAVPDAAPPPPDAEPPPSTEDQIADLIRRKIEANRAQIESCHERATQGEAPPQGRLDIALRVLPGGDVAEVRVVKNDTGSEALGACVVALVQGWRFPGPPHNGIDYVWPFIFSPRTGR